MGFTVEVKYFNAFWLKKVVKATDDEWPSWPGIPWNPYNSAYVTDSTKRITSVDFPWNSVPSAKSDDGTANMWYIEESRIRGGFNNVSVDLGVKAYMTSNRDKQIHKFNSMIYSGIFNSSSGLNNTNVFSVGDPITRSADPKDGAIQRLYAEDTNINIFQENKVAHALVDKNAIYTAEGGAITTAAAAVIGQIRTYKGEYGISRNPESFAVYGYRKYFTDKNKGVVLRLSNDGITEISGYGMVDYFRDYMATLPDSWQRIVINGGAYTLDDGYGSVSVFDVTADSCKIDIGSLLEIVEGTAATDSDGNLITVVNVDTSNNRITLSTSISLSGKEEVFFTKYVKGKLTGGYDIHNQNYVLSMQSVPPSESTDSSTYNTISFDEESLGWVSLYTYKPTFVGSLRNKYFSLFDGSIYEHYDSINPDSRGNFYGTRERSTITFIFNPNVSISKNFKTINYEGSNGWEITSIESDIQSPDREPNVSGSYIENKDTANSIYSYEEGSYIENGVTYRAGFNRKENKYVANLVNNSTARAGEVVFGDYMSGIKGYFTTVTMKTDATTQVGYKKELFTASSDYTTSAN